uniref:Uncharacterized protein n=1 Tax=Anguilla anguilla TaxID=7936 RepID=A0A0E9SVG9_ANGAN
MDYKITNEACIPYLHIMILVLFRFTVSALGLKVFLSQI